MTNLKERLSNVISGREDEEKGSSDKFSGYCSISYARECCKGSGYQLSKKGPYLHASLCDCVRSCPTCLGNLFKTDEEGKSRPCARPLPNVVVNFFNEAHIPARYLDATLDRFKNYTGNGEVIMEKLQKLLSCYPIKSQSTRSQTSEGGVIISGPVGVGKTFVLASMAKELVRKGYSVKFVDFFQLLAEIKAAFNRKESEESLLKPLIEVDVLLIDELGKGRNTEFELTIIDQIVMGRYNQDKPIFATTNYMFKDSSDQHSYNVDLTQKRDGLSSQFSPDQFGLLKNRVGTRIFSRLEETCLLLELAGQDYRRMLASEKGVFQ